MLPSGHSGMKKKKKNQTGLSCLVLTKNGQLYSKKIYLYATEEKKLCYCTVGHQIAIGQLWTNQQFWNAALPPTHIESQNRRLQEHLVPSCTPCSEGLGYNCLNGSPHLTQTIGFWLGFLPAMEVFQVWILSRLKREFNSSLFFR